MMKRIFRIINLLLTNTQISKRRKAFQNNSSANIKLSKPQLYKIRQLGGFLGKTLGPLLKTELHLIGNVLKPLATSVLIPLELTAAAAAATDAAIHKKMFRSAFTTLIISNVERNDVTKIVKSLKGSGLLTKGVSETIINEAKEQKGGFFWMLLGTLGGSLLGNLLTCKGTIRVGDGTARAG